MNSLTYTYTDMDTDRDILNDRKIYIYTCKQKIEREIDRQIDIQIEDREYGWKDQYIEM